MMKLSTKYGDIFSCGWLPPVGKMHCGFMAVFAVELYRLEEPEHHRFPPALGEEGLAVEPTGTWLCAGNSEIFRVWEVSPPLSPNAIPLPTWTGLRPCRFGRPKFTLPSPP